MDDCLGVLLSMAQPQMFARESSNVAAIGYDTENMELYVQFRNGRLYKYFNCPHFLFNDFLSATSAGQFFDTQIRKSGMAYEQVTPDYSPKDGGF